MKFGNKSVKIVNDIYLQKEKICTFYLEKSTYNAHFVLDEWSKELAQYPVVKVFFWDENL